MPAKTHRLVFALRPDEAVDAQVRHCKRRLLAAAGPQLYATDPPHATLYVAEFPAAKVSAALRAAGHLAGKCREPLISIDGWHVFESDPLTGAHTLVLRFVDDTCQQLRHIQLRAVLALAALRDGAATYISLAERLAHLTDQQRQRAALFGFPFVGGGWIPHLTIASVRPTQWPHVEEVFHLSRPPEGQRKDHSRASGRFTALDVFELHGLEPHPLAAFSLASRHIGKAA